MGCHGQVWPDSPETAPLREAWANHTALRWKRVNALPGYVYFHHGVHVQFGITCDQCHGRVDLMSRVYQIEPMTMSWCLDCHRKYQAKGATHATTNCTTCHR